MPNGVILGYQVYRNNSNIANTTETVYDDTGLTPNTYYSYYIESFNVIDSTVSSEVVFKTLEGIPTGISAPALTVLNSTSIFVMWMEPTVTHGAISQSILLVQSEGSEYIEVFRGNVFSYVVTNLRPFTSYSFIVQACTNGGCGSSTSSQNRTAQAPPTFQPAPTVTTLGATELLLQWEAPAEPNGIILGYVVNQREAPFDGDGVSVETVDEATRSLVVDGLRPFTRYQYQVESYTEAGGTESEWSEGRTGEAGIS
jgi:usherin